MTDPDSANLNERWCCFTCCTTFPLGSMQLGSNANTLRCSNCGSEDTHPAEREVVVLEAYFGRIGTRH